MTIRIHYNDLDIVFVENYYDMPLTGLCRYNGGVARFEIDDDIDFYHITLLSPWQKVKVLFNKWAFEFCVGKHWSYKDGKCCGTFSGFTPLTKFYFWMRKK